MTCPKCHASVDGHMYHVPGGQFCRVNNARALWAVRVLDVWRAAAVAPRKRAYEFDEHGDLYVCEWEPFARMGQIRDRYQGKPEAARHAAAQAVFPTLNADVRAKLGECP